MSLSAVDGDSIKVFEETPERDPVEDEVQTPAFPRTADSVTLSTIDPYEAKWLAATIADGEKALLAGGLFLCRKKGHAEELWETGRRVGRSAFQSKQITWDVSIPASSKFRELYLNPVRFSADFFWLNFIRLNIV